MQVDQSNHRDGTRLDKCRVLQCVDSSACCTTICEDELMFKRRHNRAGYTTHCSRVWAAASRRQVGQTWEATITGCSSAGNVDGRRRGTCSDIEVVGPRRARACQGCRRDALSVSCAGKEGAGVADPTLGALVSSCPPGARNAVLTQPTSGSQTRNRASVVYGSSCGAGCVTPLDP